MQDARGLQVMTRIGFAERWLRHAKQHCGDGDVTRGLLSVVLAEAEMHYALETGGMSVKGPARRMMTPALLTVGALAAAVLAVTMWLSPAPPARSAVGAAPIVKLGSPVGSVLDLVQTPTVAPVRLSSPVRDSSRSGLVASRAVRPMVVDPGRTGPLGGVPPTLPVPAPSVAVAPLAPPAIGLSTVDLIDLVLAADRMLRRVPTTP